MRMSWKGVAAGSVIAALGALGSGCSCDSPTGTENDAARPMRIDADLDAPSNSTDDVFAPERDDANIDTGPSEGFDSGAGMALNCVHRHRFGEDFWYLARDEDVSVASHASVASRPGLLVGVYSTTPRMGARRLEVFRYRVGLGGMDPVVLAGTDGGALPSVIAAGDGFWVAFVVGSEIRLARFSADMAPVGTPVTIASEATSTPPGVALAGSSGFVVWATGTTVRGRPIDAMGMPTGPAATLATAERPVQRVSIHRIGGAGTLAVSWADGGRPRVARLMGGSLGTAEFVAGDPGIFTGLDMGGQSAGTREGLPLGGATVYDLNDSGSRDVVFRVLNDSAVPSFPAATVAMGGDHAWSASVEPYLSGYALAYRAALPGIDRPALRIGYLDREGCRLGSVTDRLVVGLIDSETGAVPDLGVDENTMLIVWSDERAGEYFDYWAAVLTCTERS